LFKGISWDSLRINEFCCFMLRRHRNDKLELNEQQKTSAFKENEFSPTMLTNFSIGNVTHHQARMYQGVRLKTWPCLAAGGCIKSPPSAGSTSKGHSPAVKLTMTQTFQLQQYFKQNTYYLHVCIKIGLKKNKNRLSNLWTNILNYYYHYIFTVKFPICIA